MNMRDTKSLPNIGVTLMRPRHRALLFGVSLCFFLIVETGGSTAVEAQVPAEVDAEQFESGWTECPNTRILDDSPSVGYPLSLPPGEYEVAISVDDSYPGREFARPEHQSREQVDVTLYTTRGQVTSKPNPDLDDGVADVSWEGSLGRVTVEDEVVGVEIAHIGPNTGGAHSLNVRCVWVYRIVEIPMFSLRPTAVLTALVAVGVAIRFGVPR